MIDLSNLDYVKGLQSNLRTCFESEGGKEVMKFLENCSGWYESIFDSTNRDRILLNAGRREVIATLKTLLRLTPEEVVFLMKQRNEQ